MDSLRRTALRTWPSLRRQSFALEHRTIQTSARHLDHDRKYVRIAGPTSYATRDDIIEFMQRNGVDMSALVAGKSRRLNAMYPPPRREDGSVGTSGASLSGGEAVADPASVESVSNEVKAQSSTSFDGISDETNTAMDSGITVDESSVDESILTSSVAVKKLPLLAQSTSEAFMNISTWYYEAESFEEAKDIANKLRGKICGMKLVRAAAVDRRVVSEVPGFTANVDKGGRRIWNHPQRNNVALVAPSNEERDRSLLVTGLRHMTYPRAVWGFFRGYDVAHVRMLRRAGVASVIFREVSEMERAFRERSNLQVQSHPNVKIGYHC